MNELLLAILFFLLIIALTLGILLQNSSSDTIQSAVTSSALKESKENTSRTVSEKDIFSSRGKTVLNSQGEIGWHLKDKLCADGSTPELSQTSDPRIFGPIIWPGLHIMAENYPEKADKGHKKACVQFLEGLPWMLPCGHCGSHLLKRESSAGEESIEDLLKDEEAKITKRRNLRKACKGRKNLRAYLVGAHNNVSQNNKKPIWTPEDANKKYCQMPVCLQKCSEYDETRCKQSIGCVWNANEDTGKMECQSGWFEDGIPYPSGQSCVDETF